MPRHSRALTPAFTRLWTAGAVANLGDGVMLAATPHHRPGRRVDRGVRPGKRATPSELLGRVGSVYHLASVGGSVLGALLGGLLAARVGLVAVMTVLAWRRLGDVRAGQPVQR